MLPHKDISSEIAAANASLASGDIQDSLDRLERLDEMEPIPEAVHRLGSRIAATQDDPIEGVRRLDLALAAGAVTTARDLVNRAQFCHVAGRLEEALSTLDRIPDRIDPKVGAVSLFLRIRCLARLGRIEEARQAIRTLTNLEGRSLRTQWLIAEVNASAGDHSGARQRYEMILADRRVPAQIRTSVAFGLSRACDRLGDSEAAFEAATIGNGLLRPTFDAVAHRSATDRLIEWATPDRFERIKTASHRDSRPVFVVGLPRTGTSLVEQIIASHPRGAGVGERRDPILGAERLAHRIGESFPDCLDSASIEDLDRIARGHADMLDRSGFDADRIVNKVLGLDRILPLLPAAFPEGRVVLVSRDPRDQIASSYLHQLRGPGLEWACRLEDLAAARQDHDRLLQHIASILPMPVHQLQYEDLIADQSTVTSDLLDFLELEPDDACLAFHEHRRTVMTPSFDQVDKPITDVAIGRWRALESRLGPVLQAFPVA
ncbi:MAG: hypothetical protein GY895_11055 [Phycisphaera sp.]|nr:hypothetical protein [Phycisphaera sp.]